MVQSFALVGLGGAIGAMARYGLTLAMGRFWFGTFPLATFAANVLGSLAMGVLVGLLGRFLPEQGEAMRLFFAVGVLGGFTTFSSFSLDTISLIERGALAQAVIYVALSVVVCLVGLYLGLSMTKGGTA